MNNFILVHNYDNDAEVVLTQEQFNYLQFMFSNNCSYREITEHEYNQRMGLLSNAN
jgi:predicted DNA-binding protein YlxM (UPF0122 family)